MHKGRQDATIPTVTYRELHRTLRVGACPVLTVTALYPGMQGEGEAVERFNEGYARIAEAFVAWAEEAWADRAKAEFQALGARAPYEFPKREIVLDMHGFSQPFDGEEGGEEPPRLCVVATVTRRVRRREVEACTEVFRHVWCLPHVYMCPPLRGKLSKLTKKERKNGI